MSQWVCVCVCMCNCNCASTQPPAGSVTTQLTTYNGRSEHPKTHTHQKIKTPTSQIMRQYYKPHSTNISKLLVCANVVAENKIKPHGPTSSSINTFDVCGTFSKTF